LRGKAVDPAIVIMLHVALGGQNDETVFFIDQMMKRNIHFDVIGLSYYRNGMAHWMIFRII
jgi:beta-galactosidase